jgi:mannosyl-3-phosphoglycerate phosphatase
MLVVFTDLDGTLLDEETYSWKAAEPALVLLRERGIPWVIVTSKTRAEVEVLRERMDNRHPFIVENGGAAFIPSGYFPFPAPEVLEFGTPYAVLTAALDEASLASGCRVQAFHTMNDAEVAGACGLPIEDARLARQRGYDEPFTVIDVEKTDALLAELERRGLRWTRGGRFHHALGNNDKGVAVAALLELFGRAYGEVDSIGLGDSPNDAEFLRLMDTPVLVTGQGPRAWNEAVLSKVVPD